MAAPLPHRLMTLEEFIALPEDNSARYELQEGVLVVARTGGPAPRIAASEALLAVEFLSPGSRRVDLHLKPVEYAEAGIPHHWVADLAPPVPTITGTSWWRRARAASSRRPRRTR